MQKDSLLRAISETGLIAVIRGPSAELTLKMVEALVAGGVTGIEITYSTPNAEEVVKTLKHTYDNKIILGMGTLTQPLQAETAKSAGASFLVSPVCEPQLVRAMVNSGLLVMAGALSPTEIHQAYTLGVDVVKVFPGSLTGPGYIKAIKGPFPNIPLMPTGGVSLANLQDWFASGVIAVGVGGELCPSNLAESGNFKEITQRAKNFLRAVRESRKG